MASDPDEESTQPGTRRPTVHPDNRDLARLLTRVRLEAYQHGRQIGRLLEEVKRSPAAVPSALGRSIRDEIRRHAKELERLADQEAPGQR